MDQNRKWKEWLLKKGRHKQAASQTSVYYGKNPKIVTWRAMAKRKKNMETRLSQQVCHGIGLVTHWNF
jgi:hypothetical protein